MRSKLLHPAQTLAFVLVLLPLAGACTRKSAESKAPATVPAPVASETSAPVPSPPLGSEPSGASGAPAPAIPRSTAIASGHLTLTGAYQADSDAEVTCAQADTGLQLTLRAPGQPRVLIMLDDLAAKGVSGTYKGQVTVVGVDAGESNFRPSYGKASAEVTVDAVAQGKAVSGTFATTYTGDAGKGTVQGRFDRCVWTPEPADQP
jgi:hypothetical protein